MLPFESPRLLAVTNSLWLGGPLSAELTELRPCPFGAHDKPTLVVMGGDKDNRVSVVCPEFGAVGPMTTPDAEYLWNRRYVANYSRAAPVQSNPFDWHVISLPGLVVYLLSMKSNVRNWPRESKTGLMIAYNLYRYNCNSNWIQGEQINLPRLEGFNL